ncbi:MAG TPA: hypothetical protein VFP40_20495, partial [Terriglobales bacterium]|nr:hypothetical protein [Terriglobales bacterium]
PYGAVYVPRGIYNVSKPLHITRGIRFFGAGRGETTITGYSADQGPVMVVSPLSPLDTTEFRLGHRLRPEPKTRCT